MAPPFEVLCPALREASPWNLSPLPVTEPHFLNVPPLPIDPIETQDLP